MQIILDDQSVYCYTGGRPFDGDGPVLLMVHGAAHDHGVWTLQSRWFAHHGWRVLVPDLPGHGRTAGPVLTTIEALAQWLQRLLDHLGIGRAALVGHSMGSLAVLELAARMPDRVTALALLGTAFPMAVSDTLLSAARGDDHAAFEMINAWAHAAPMAANPAPGMCMTGINMRLMERSAPGVLYHDLAACNAYTAGLAGAARIVCPTLVLSGRRDQMTPPGAARAIAAALPGASMVALDDCGHAMMAEQPDRVLDALRGLLAGVTA